MKKTIRYSTKQEGEIVETFDTIKEASSQTRKGQDGKDRQLHSRSGCDL